MTLVGKVAVVTGGGRNIGRSIALAFAREGALVAVNVRTNIDEGRAVVAELRSLGSRGLLVSGDVSDPAAVSAMFEEVDASFGKIDVLVNNASIRPTRRFIEMTPEEWSSVIAVNLTGAFLCAKSAAPRMIAQGSGCIVNIIGATGFTGAKARAHVVAAKAGLHGLTKALAQELGGSGIRANSVDPGWVDLSSARGRSVPDEVVNESPLRRAPTADDVAAACVFLASDSASAITGEVIHVNAGRFMF